jgi:hypothetical protein
MTPCDDIIAAYCCTMTDNKDLFHFYSYEKKYRNISNDPYAGSPTKTLLRLLLPLNDQA